MGTITQGEATAQVAAAHTKYTSGVTTGQVKTDQDARVAAANATHTAVTNAQLDTELNSTLSTINENVFETYSGGNIVTGVNPTEMETLVATAIAADDLFTAGGQIPPTSYVTSANASDYVDPLWLIEASKLTGEKFF